MSPDVITQVEQLTNTVSQQFGAFALVIIAMMVAMSFFALRFGNRLLSSFERNDKEGDKRIDTFGQLLAQQIQINTSLAADATARSQVQIEQAATLRNMLIELKAMRADVRAWPEIAAVEIRRMQEQVNELQTTVNLLVSTADNQRIEVQKIQAALVDLRTGIELLIKQLVPAEAPPAPAADAPDEDAPTRAVA